MSNKVTLRFFASLRERIGHGHEEYLTQSVSAGQLRDELIARGGAYAEALSREKLLRCAVNQVMQNEDAPLPAGAEVAFFPPVTGG
ncbi:MAG: hypothetical protein RLZZ271_1670 [Pseudomonadota bacterium]|jgi:molybdopterin synthase sulfur carrier subunit